MRGEVIDAGCVWCTQDEAKGEADSLDRSDVSSADEYDSDSEIDDVSVRIREGVAEPHGG